jgi:hypothetical protein
MGVARSTNGRAEKYVILVGRPEGKRPLGRPRHSWEDDNRTDIRDIGWEGVDWIHWFRIGNNPGFL